MTAESEYLAIAHTDFDDLYRIDPREAEDRMIALICDPELAAKRIVQLILNKSTAENAIDDQGMDDVAFRPTIETLKNWGPHQALRKELVTFVDLVRLSLNPKALRLAHKAVYDIDFEEFKTPMLSPEPDNAALHETPSMFALSASDINDDEVDGVFERKSQTSALPSLNRCFDDWADVPGDEFAERCRASGVLTTSEFDLHAVLNGAPAEDVSVKPISQEVIAIENGRVSVLAPISMIPDGLCRLTLIEVGAGRNIKRTLTLLLQLQSVSDRWYWEKSIDDLFGRTMTGATIRAALETTTHSNFYCPEVETFVAELSTGEQKSLAQAYISSKHGEGA